MVLNTGLTTGGACISGGAEDSDVIGGGPPEEPTVVMGTTWGAKVGPPVAMATAALRFFVRGRYLRTCAIAVGGKSGSTR
jgi:hypothetical protein